MSNQQPTFALLGRCYPSEVFEQWYEVSLTARRSRQAQGGAWTKAPGGNRVWRGSGECIDGRTPPR